VEIQFADYIYPAYDQIVSEAAKMRYRSGGQFSTPIVVRIALRRRHLRRPDPQPEPGGLFTHIPGLKTVIPSNPYDAKGLLIAAIEDDDPVIFLEPKRLYNGPFDGWHEKPVKPWAQPEAEVPTEKYTVPLGKAKVTVREGRA
jgi:2-oxoisovalerate dehydrogenase E1 component beta subunit